MRASGLAGSLKRALFPARCIVCNKITPEGGDVCLCCESSLNFISGDSCELCGQEKKLCLCRGKKNSFEKFHAPFYYENGIKRAVRGFKFNGRKWLCVPLSRYMAARAAEKFDLSEIDVVTCVPFTAKQLRKRGYNQSCLLAEGVAERLGLPFDGKLLVKLYDTDVQHKTARENRKGNVMGVFDVTRPEKIRGKTVLLCDDIKTTGATLDECSKMLIINGANKVYGLCLAIPREREPGKGRQEPWQA